MTPLNDPWRDHAAQVRDGSLEPLAVQLGYRQDPANPARWRRPGSVLSIRGSQFFDHRQGRSGGGAIDLVMHVRSCRFRKARGGFWLPANTDDLDALLIVESAVDALSTLLLLAPTLPPDTLLASTAGVAVALPRWLQAFHAPRTLCAFDADRGGDQAAISLRRHTPSCSRLRPVGAKDWNDLLRRSRLP